MNLSKIKNRSLYLPTALGGPYIAGKVECRCCGRVRTTSDTVVLARDYTYMCSDPGQDLISRISVIRV